MFAITKCPIKDNDFVSDLTDKLIQTPEYKLLDTLNTWVNDGKPDEKRQTALKK